MNADTYKIARRAVRASADSRSPIAEIKILCRKAPRGQRGEAVRIARKLLALHHAPAPPTVSLEERLARRLERIGAEQINGRWVSTPAGLKDEYLALRHRQGSLWLIGAEYWYEYSRRFGSRYMRCAYLCGRDEGQHFAVRVPSTCSTVAHALAFLKPSAIVDAEKKGLPVRRQGDIYFRPMRIAEHDMGALRGTRHEARPRADGGLTIVHPQHRAVRLSGKYRWRAYAQRPQNGGHGD